MFSPLRRESIGNVMALLALVYFDFKYPPAIPALTAQIDPAAFRFFGIKPNRHFIPAIGAFYLLDMFDMDSPSEPGRKRVGEVRVALLVRARVWQRIQPFGAAQCGALLCGHALFKFCRPNVHDSRDFRRVGKP